MADNTAAKLAAGRKMLQEFQKKKTVKQSPDNNYKKQLLDRQSDETETNIISNFVVESGYKINNESVESSVLSHSNSTNHLDSAVSPAASFFDKFDNVIQAHDNDISSSVENSIPLAGVLFTAQNDNSDFINNESLANSINAESISKQNHLILSQYDPDETSSRDRFNDDEGVNDIKTVVEISKLQQQLQFHIKTVEFLVVEKNELTAKINEYEKTIFESKSQTEDLNGRLNTSRHHASHLEMECFNLKHKNQQAETHISQLLQDINAQQSADNNHKKQLSDLQEELQEVKTLMNDKILENKNLVQKIEEMNFQINSNELRLQQMMQGNNQECSSPSLKEHCQHLEQNVNILRQQLSQIEVEKNQSSLRFQQYVQILNNQIESLNEKQEELQIDNELLENREESLIQQISVLEKQLQLNQYSSNPNENKTPQPAADPVIMEKITMLEDENNKIKAELHGKESSLELTLLELNEYSYQVKGLKSTLQQLQSESPDVTKLNAAIESDRLAAQKATAQNAKMKLDLQHLEKAFEQMTKSKLELVELLQAEKNLSKTLTLKLVENEELSNEIKSKLLAKDEEMIRLQAASSELQKEMLKQAQITDRLNHYEAQGQSSELLQSELQTSKNTIQLLSDENEKLKKALLNTNASSENLPSCSEDTEEHKSCHGNAETTDGLTLNIPTTDAMNKLQDKFTKLMKEVADLSDEKQKLEHLVLQLQGETETICEYIALYQKQRGILKQRENERNAQLTLLSKEREHMKSQLENLKTLIGQLIQKNSYSQTSGHISPGKAQIDLDNENSQIVQKIMDLLTEIKGNHLIEPSENCNGLESFHPCPWCSGKLINV